MVDVVISYGHGDKPLVRQLSALLQTRGYSVWWDIDLDAGEGFRDRIQQEISQARAVLVVWTENSVGSDWVRAEANLAQSLRKLVPTKLRALSVTRIPLPFGELHTPDLEDHDAVAQAIDTALIRPQVSPSWLQRLTALARHELLSWLSIAGGALTISAGLTGAIELSKVLNALLENWSAFARLLWNAVTLFRFNISTTDALLLTFFALVSTSMLSSLAKKSLLERTTRQGGIFAKHSVLLPVVQWSTVAAALVAVLACFYLNGNSIYRKFVVKADQSLATAAQRLFPQSPQCAKAAHILYRPDSIRFERLYPNLHREAITIIDACCMENGVSKNQLEEAGKVVSSQLAQDLRTQVTPSFVWIAVFGQILLPFGLYLCVRPFTDRRISAQLLAKRLWIMIGVTSLLVALNSGLLLIESVNWRALLDQS